MNFKTWLLSATLFCGTALAAETYLYEPFDFYSDYNTTFINGATISEMGGSVKALSLKPEKPGAMCLNKPFAVSLDKKIANFKCSFIVRFPADAPRNMILRMLFQGKDAGVQRLDSCFELYGGSRLSGNVTVKRNTFRVPNKRILPLIPDNTWHRCEVRVQDSYVSLWVERDGKMYLDAACYIKPDLILSGLNLGSAGPAMIRELKVEDHKEAGTAQQIPADGMVLPVPAEGLRFTFRPVSNSAQFSFTMEDGSEKPPVYSFKSDAQSYNVPVVKEVATLEDGKLVRKKKAATEKRHLFDNLLRVSGPGANFPIYTRPLLFRRYMPHQIPAMIADWQNLGVDVQDHTFEFQIINNQLWVDGNFYCNIPVQGALKSVRINSVYAYPEIKVLKGVIKYEDGLTVEAPLPIAFKDYFPTALCKENQGSYMLECDGYLSRSPFEGLRDCYLRSIPKAQYNKAIVTYSMDGDTSKSTDLSLRLTQLHRNGGRSPNAMAMATVTLPRSKEGEIKTVELDIPVGKIQDIVFLEDKIHSMDVEVLGGLYEKNHYYVSRYNKPAEKPSSVRIHGVKLFKSPATILVKNGTLGNLFIPGETAHVTAEVGAVKPGTYTLEWIVKDEYGKEIERTTDDVTFAAAGEKKEIKHDFKAQTIGYYEYTVNLKEKDKNLITYNGSYVRLPDPVRNAVGAKSPFYSWNRGGAHGSLAKKEEWGEVFRRLGIRRTLIRKHTEEELKEYGLIQAQIPYLRSTKTKPEERAADLDAQIRNWLKKSPSIDQAIIFHESGGGPYPQEIYGVKTELTEKQIEADKGFLERGVELAKAYRRVAPHIKLVIGNSGTSERLLATLFRQKFPRELIDYMGEEGVGLTQLPEAFVATAYWNLRELARIYGYKDLMPTACYEWKARVMRWETPGTDFPARDRLIAMAWKNILIPFSVSQESANSYYNTVWNGCCFSRGSLLQPNPQALATAVFTKIFDLAEFVRMIPTGSLTAYALEFKRADGKFVYAFWTARGSVKAELKFADGANPVYSNRSGQERPCEKIETINGIPAYVISGKALESISVEMQRTFDPEPGNGAKAQVAAAMDKAADWELVMGEDKRFIATRTENARVPGKFTLSEVTDDVKGACLEVKLIPNEKLTASVQEYARIQLKKPVEIPGTPHTVGVWVKGNSSWGKIYLELEDADGEIWYSTGSGGYGCPTYDWPGYMTVNYDGWHFLQMPLTAASPVENNSPGDNEWQWTRERTGDGKLTFPVKVKGVGFMYAKKALNILEMEDVKDLSIRFKDFSAY